MVLYAQALGGRCEESFSLGMQGAQELGVQLGLPMLASTTWAPQGSVRSACPVEL